MDRSTLGKWLLGIGIAVFLGFIAGRQQLLMEQQREILREIQQLRTSVQSAAPAAAVPKFNLKIDNSAGKGNAKAEVALIEFSDFECPYCGRYFRESYPQLERDYVATGKIHYVFRHFPLADIHPNAVRAAEAAECARLQEKFWPFHDRLFANQTALNRTSIEGYARAVGIEMKSFANCLDGTAASTVRSDLDAGTGAGITATPTFFLGFTQPDGSVLVVDKLVGAKPYAAFQAALDRMLTSSQ